MRLRNRIFYGERYGIGTRTLVAVPHVEGVAACRIVTEIPGISDDSVVIAAGTAVKAADKARAAMTE